TGAFTGGPSDLHRDHHSSPATSSNKSKCLFTRLICRGQDEFLCKVCNSFWKSRGTPSQFGTTQTRSSAALTGSRYGLEWLGISLNLGEISRVLRRRARKSA